MLTEKQEKYFLVISVFIVGFASIYFVLGFGFRSAENTIRDRLSRGEDPLNDVPIIEDVPRDAIPPLDFPKYVPSSEVQEWLFDEDVVLGVEFDGDARAYPIKIMNWHEIVNDTIGEQSVVVTYCPLCDSGIVFNRRLDEINYTFGNTGALYESAMVMYDRQTESYWYQVVGESIRGDLLGKRLNVLPSFLTTWGLWRTRYPETQVLSIQTGYERPYLTNPYLGYDELNSKPAFPVSVRDRRLSPKERVLGLVINGRAKAYPVGTARGTAIEDDFQGRRVLIEGDESGTFAQAFFLEGEEKRAAPITSTFWFGWAAAYPETEIYE